jgi:hypothetical protein
MLSDSPTAVPVMPDNGRYLEVIVDLNEYDGIQLKLTGKEV